MTVHLKSRKDFTLANAHRVGQGEGVVFTTSAKGAITAARKSFIAYLDADRTRFIYGTTSGAGQSAKKAIPADQQKKYAQAWGKVPPGSGFGGSDLPERAVRMIIFARLANYIEGNAKARPVEAARIASMLDHPLPRLPLSGQVGAGEILPLFHIMSAMPDGDVEEAEPMARINGSPVSAALAADVALTARNRLALATQVLALAIEGYRAPLEPYDAALVSYAKNAHEKTALKSLRSWLIKASKKDRLPHQAPVSFRILPTVLAAAEEAVATLEQVAGIALSSVTDNPVYDLPSKKHPLGQVMSTGGYHNAQAAPAIDNVNARFADLVTLADRMTMKLHEAAHLPESLAKLGSGTFGTTLLSFVQIGYGEEARHAARRTFMPLSEGGGIGGQNDVASATTFAYQKSQTAGFCLEAALALLAVSASQALWVTARDPAPALAGVLKLVRKCVPPVKKRGGRDMGAQLKKLQEIFAASAISGALPR